MRILTPLSTTCFALVAALASTGAHAANGFYMGGSVGNTQAGFKDPQDDLDIDLDGSDFGWKLYGGFKFTLLSVEGGYTDFGLIEDSNNEAEISGLTAFGKLSTGLGPVELFGKVGGFIWETDLNVEAVEQTYEEDGFDPAVGIGAGFNLGGVGLRAEYEYFNIDTVDNLSMLSVGATIWF